MSERLTGENHEIEPRLVTGLFRLQKGGVPLEFSSDGKALPASGEPRFVVKDVSVRHSSSGWSEFAEILATHLEGVESELFRGNNVYTVAESPIDELTAHMEPGEIRRVSSEEYAEAYIRKYGDVIQGPLFW